MLINADFRRRAVVLPDQYEWVASPQAGVERVMLDRVGAEKARATSIVRYVPQSFFPPHQHPAGEEILVLSGTFSDEDGDYPAGWYLRNPPGSSHKPFSREGATIFVKLRQMSGEESDKVRVDTGDPAAWERQDGHDTCVLFSNAMERVCLRRLMPDETLLTGVAGGAEILVLDGDILYQGNACPGGSWLRLPDGENPSLVAGSQGATVYLKTGHLGRPLSNE